MFVKEIVEEFISLDILFFYCCELESSKEKTLADWVHDTGRENI